MPVLTDGPFDRSKQIPTFCKACPCFEFIAAGSTKDSKYVGHEKCLSCPHKANQHIWVDIKEVCYGCRINIRELHPAHLLTAVTRFRKHRDMESLHLRMTLSRKRKETRESFLLRSRRLQSEISDGLQLKSHL